MWNPSHRIGHSCCRALPWRCPAASVRLPPRPPPESAAAEEPCLIVGALYGGPITDAGYNQAMHEAVMAIKENIPCVQDHRGRERAR